MKKLKIYLYVSVIINIFLITLILITLKTSYFDPLLFEKSLPFMCENAYGEDLSFAGKLCEEWAKQEEYLKPEP